MEKNGQLNVLFLAMEQSRDPIRTYDLIANILQRVGSGELRGVIDDHILALADAGEAHRYAETGKAFGRIIIAPSR